jgi:hypothetical protein
MGWYVGTSWGVMIDFIHSCIDSQASFHAVKIGISVDLTSRYAWYSRLGIANDSIFSFEYKNNMRIEGFQLLIEYSYTNWAESMGPFTSPLAFSQGQVSTNSGT